MSGTYSPQPALQFLDDNGDPAASYQLFTYLAGTSTKTTTWTDVNQTSANTNPIILDSAGRATIFLDPGVSYKFVLADDEAADPPASNVWSRDNIQGVPTAPVPVTIEGTAGEALSANDAVYLSAGDGSRTAGRWYKTDADNDYASSTADAIGFAPSAIGSGSSGDIVLAGRLTGFSGLTAGSLYYLSATAGAITSSAPANKRAIGVADSTTALVVGQFIVPDVWTNLPEASATVDGIVTTGSQTFAGSKTFNAAANFGSDLLVTGTGALGYKPGGSGGGTVTQATDKSTGVTLNRRTGQITTNNASLAAGAEVTFTVTNSASQTVSAIIINHTSGGTTGAYSIQVNNCANGSFDVTISNLTAGGLAEALVLQFLVLRGAIT